MENSYFKISLEWLHEVTKEASKRKFLAGFDMRNNFVEYFIPI